MRTQGEFISLCFYMKKRGFMEKVKRPKKVQKTQKNYLSNEKYQDFAENQFKNIYDKLDEIIEKLNN